jgi:hypothetical protein
MFLWDAWVTDGGGDCARPESKTATKAVSIDKNG